ncbi:MAG: host-nuclease inhibitor Gam family protein [Rubrivivax sp.]|nr:host-nuclease inhibitor Gam family protein [Rubrivivax sp.]
MTTQIETIENAARAYAAARGKLAEKVTQLQEGLDNLRRNNLPAIKRNLARAAEAESELRALVEQHPDLFQKPRTLVLHGIRVGFEKGKGAISFEDADQVVKLVKKKLPELLDQLVKTEEKPLKGGLKQLTVAQLKSVGCTVEETGDQVVVRAVDSDVDKLVKALLKGAEEEAAEQQ